MARYIDADALLKSIVDEYGRNSATEMLVIGVLNNLPKADVEEKKDCNLCIYNYRHATEYPCSHCRNCYTDKFKLDETRTPKERGGEK